MPTTVFGLVVFVVFLAPGLVYVSVREFSRERTRPDHSAFRETGQVALVSVACLAVVLLAFAFVRSVAENRTPDVGALIAEPNAYATTHYRSLIAWGCGLLAAACIIAALLARYLPAPEKLAFHSAWWALFEERRPSPDAIAVVSCVLEDGSWVEGLLATYSRDTSDTPDRELTLAAPIRFRAVGTDEPQALDCHAMSLSARRISTLAVTYVTDEALDAAASSGTTSA